MPRIMNQTSSQGEGHYGRGIGDLNDDINALGTSVSFPSYFTDAMLAAGAGANALTPKSNATVPLTLATLGPWIQSNAMLLALGLGVGLLLKGRR